MQRHPKHPWHPLSQPGPRRSWQAPGQRQRQSPMATGFQIVMRVSLLLGLLLLWSWAIQDVVAAFIR